MTKTIEIQVPTSYAELSPKQLKYVATLIAAGLSQETVKTKCLNKFSDINLIAVDNDNLYFSRKKEGIQNPISIQAYNYALHKMDFLYNNYIGIIPPQKISWYKSCDKLLKDTIYQQYLDAEALFQGYLHTKQEKYLYLLITTLYQNGANYSSAVAHKRAKRIKRHCTIVECTLIMMWFIGVKDYFGKRWAYFFKKNDDEQASQLNMYDIIKNQIRALTEGDITKREQVLKQGTWQALDELNDKCKEAQELEQKLKNK